MYKDFDDVVHSYDIPKELWEFENMMKERPKFNKKSKYIIKEVRSRTRTGYIVINKNKEFKEGHTHLKSYKLCKDVIYNVENELIPEGKSIYFLSSLIRLSTNKKYIDKVEKLIQLKKESR